MGVGRVGKVSRGIVFGIVVIRQYSSVFPAFGKRRGAFTEATPRFAPVADRTSRVLTSARPVNSL